MKMLMPYGLLFLVPIVAGGFTLYDGCLFECLNCVESWGKDLYDGKACAHACFETKGESIDPQCLRGGVPSKKRTQMAVTSQVCEDRCDKCLQGGSGIHLKRLSCIFSCLVQRQLPSDC